LNEARKAKEALDAENARMKSFKDELDILQKEYNKNKSALKRV